MRANAFDVVTLCLEERLNKHIKPLRTTALKPCTEFVGLRNYMYVCMCIYIYIYLYISLIPSVSSTLACQYELRNRLACKKCLQLWRHLVATRLVPFPAAAVHLEAVQGTFEIHQLRLLVNGHAKALKSAIYI
jgi:hypothetical protein